MYWNMFITSTRCWLGGFFIPTHFLREIRTQIQDYFLVLATVQWKRINIKTELYRYIKTITNCIKSKFQSYFSGKIRIFYLIKKKNKTNGQFDIELPLKSAWKIYAMELFFFFLFTKMFYSPWPASLRVSVQLSELTWWAGGCHL
jgi:hypothetical protein